MLFLIVEPCKHHAEYNVFLDGQFTAICLIRRSEMNTCLLLHFDCSFLAVMTFQTTSQNCNIMLLFVDESLKHEECHCDFKKICDV
jgi:hypothetical protein